MPFPFLQWGYVFSFITANIFLALHRRNTHGSYLLRYSHLSNIPFYFRINFFLTFHLRDIPVFPGCSKYLVYTFFDCYNLLSGIIMLYLLTSFGLCFSLLSFSPAFAAFQYIDQSCNKYGGANAINAAAAEALTAVNAAMTSMTPPRKPQFTRLLISMIGLPSTDTDRDAILTNFYSKFRR